MGETDALPGQVSLRDIEATATEKGAAARRHAARGKRVGALRAAARGGALMRGPLITHTGVAPPAPPRALRHPASPAGVEYHAELPVKPVAGARTRLAARGGCARAMRSSTTRILAAPAPLLRQPDCLEKQF